MARNLFSLPIFFIVFRETLEAAIIVSVLLGLAKQIVQGDPASQSTTPSTSADIDNTDEKDEITTVQPVADLSAVEDGQVQRRRILRKLRIQIILGAILGIFVALCIGAAFIAIWFTKAADLWSKSDELWEGIFSLIASILIFFMGITMVKMDRAKAKWRIKLERAFSGQHVDRGTKTGKWIFFLLPFITVLREGLEAVVFVGGVSLGQSATSIPIATLVGLLCGLVCGFLVYQFASRTTLTIFLIVMTNVLLLIGAGLFSRSIRNFEGHAYSVLLGTNSDDSFGTGPGSYNVHGNVWHLDCCSPDNVKISSGWAIFQAMLGWSNNGSLGTVLGYVFYWLVVIFALVYLKYTEGRTKLFGRQSAAGRRRKVAASTPVSYSANATAQQTQQEEEMQ